MNLRHKWPEDKEGLAVLTCSRCGMEVKTYLVKRGKLPRCSGKPAPYAQLRLDEQIKRCGYHEHGLIGGYRVCPSCGQPYTKEEKSRFEPLREVTMRRLGYRNPQPFLKF